jgi:hypothetical protein
MPARSGLRAAALVLACCSCAEPDASPSEGATTAPVTSSSCATTSDTVLLGGRVHTIHVGARADVVRKQCTIVRDTTLLLEGQPQQALLIAVNRDTILAEIVNEQIWRMSVLTPGIATTDSLRVGTPVRRLAELPGTLASGEGSYYFISPNHCGLSFGVEGVPFRARPWSHAELRTLPDSARVERILVVGSCHANGGVRILADTGAAR